MSEIYKKSIQKTIKNNLSVRGGGGSKQPEVHGGDARLSPPFGQDVFETVSVLSSLDLLCEGPIGGFVNSYDEYVSGFNLLQSIYLDDIVVMEPRRDFLQNATFQGNFMLMKSPEGPPGLNVRDPKNFNRFVFTDTETVRTALTGADLLWYSAKRQRDLKYTTLDNNIIHHNAMAASAGALRNVNRSEGFGGFQIGGWPRRYLNPGDYTYDGNQIAFNVQTVIHQPRVNGSFLTGSGNAVKFLNDYYGVATGLESGQIPLDQPASGLGDHYGTNIYSTRQFFDRSDYVSFTGDDLFAYQPTNVPCFLGVRFMPRSMWDHDIEFTSGLYPRWVNGSLTQIGESLDKKIITLIDDAYSPRIVPIKVEGFEETFLNGNYYLSGGRTGDIGESFYWDQLRVLTGSSSTYERSVSYLKSGDTSARIETGITPNNTTGWILNYNNQDYYYLDNIVRRQFYLSGTGGFDFYNPQDLYRVKWTGDILYTNTDALDYGYSSNWYNFRRENSDEFESGWQSYSNTSPGDIQYIHGTGFGYWDTINTFAGPNGDRVGEIQPIKIGAEPLIVHYDDNSGISFNSKVTWADLSANRREEQDSLGQVLTLNCFVSGQQVQKRGNFNLYGWYNQNPKAYDGTFSELTIQSNIYGRMFGPYVQTSYISNEDGSSNTNLFTDTPLNYSQSLEGSPVLVRDGKFFTGLNGETTVSFADNRFEDELRYLFAKQLGYYPDTGDQRIRGGRQFWHDHGTASQPEIIAVGNLVANYGGYLGYKGFNYANVGMNVRYGEEFQETMPPFSSGQAEYPLRENLVGPFDVGGNISGARVGDGSRDVRETGNGGTADFAGWMSNVRDETDERSYSHIVQRIDVKKVEVLIQVNELNDTVQRGTWEAQTQGGGLFSAPDVIIITSPEVSRLGTPIPTYLYLQAEVGFEGRDPTTTELQTLYGTVASNAPYITKLFTLDLPDYSEIASEYPGESLSAIAKKVKRYVRIRKMNYETDSVLVNRDVMVAGLTEIINSNFTYPYSALAGVTVDARNFSTPPIRSYDVRMKKCLIPSNYYPLQANGVDKRFIPDSGNIPPDDFSASLDTNKLYYTNDFVYDTEDGAGGISSAGNLEAPIIQIPQPIDIGTSDFSISTKIRGFGDSGVLFSKATLDGSGRLLLSSKNGNLIASIPRNDDKPEELNVNISSYRTEYFSGLADSEEASNNPENWVFYNDAAVFDLSISKSGNDFTLNISGNTGNGFQAIGSQTKTISNAQPLNYAANEFTFLGDPVVAGNDGRIPFFDMTGDNVLTGKFVQLGRLDGKVRYVRATGEPIERNLGIIAFDSLTNITTTTGIRWETGDTSSVGGTSSPSWIISTGIADSNRKVYWFSTQDVDDPKDVTTWTQGTYGAGSPPLFFNTGELNLGTRYVSYLKGLNGGNGGSNTYNVYDYNTPNYTGLNNEIAAQYGFTSEEELPGLEYGFSIGAGTGQVRKGTQFVDLKIEKDGETIVQYNGTKRGEALTSNRTTDWDANVMVLVQTVFDTVNEELNVYKALRATPDFSTGLGGTDYTGFLLEPIEYPDRPQIYRGDWDGTFRTDWTDNPAWILYDLLINKNYGLGDYIEQDEDIDIFNLYRIGRYCDAVDASGFYSGLSDNRGGLEPRYSCNIQFTESSNAFEMINAVASIFNGVGYWSNGAIKFFMDKPDEVSAVFNNGNVYDGIFEYSDLHKNARFNHVEIFYKDKTDDFKAKKEYVQDEEDIRNRGIIRYEEPARGFTSSSQAKRFAKHILYSNKFETELVNFDVSQQGLIVEPGDIIQINDIIKSFQIDYAKILAKNTTDKTIFIEDQIATGDIITGSEGGVYVQAATGQTGLADLYDNVNFSAFSVSESVLDTYERSQVALIPITGIAKQNGAIKLSLDQNDVNINYLNLTKAGLITNVITQNNSKDNTYRVMTISPSESNRYTITAKQYSSGKFNLIEADDYSEEDIPIQEYNIGVPSNVINRPTEPAGFSFELIPNQTLGYNLTGVVTGQNGGTESKYRISLYAPNGGYETKEIEKDESQTPPQSKFAFYGLRSAGSHKIEITSLRNPESSKTLKENFMIPRTTQTLDVPFFESIKLLNENSKDLSFELDIRTKENRIYKTSDTKRIYVDIVSSETRIENYEEIIDKSFDFSFNQNRQIFRTAQRNLDFVFKIEEEGQILNTRTHSYENPAPQITEIKKMNNQDNFRVEAKIENNDDLIGVYCHTGISEDFQPTNQNIIRYIKLYPSKEYYSLEMSPNTEDELFYKFIPYDTFNSGISYTGEVRETVTKTKFNSDIRSIQDNILSKYYFDCDFDISGNLSLNSSGSSLEEGRYVIKYGGYCDENSEFSLYLDKAVHLNLPNSEGNWVEKMNFVEVSGNVNEISGSLMTGQIQNLKIEIKKI